MAAMMEEDAVGDKIVAMHKRQRLRARAAVIWNGVESHVDLSRRDRSSPIYFNVKKPSDRLPRVPMPSDLGNEVSPTAALLHAYRMQHARMFINENRHQRMVEHFTKYQNLDEIDLEIEEIEGADNEGIKLVRGSHTHTYTHAVHVCAAETPGPCVTLAHMRRIPPIFFSQLMESLRADFKAFPGMGHAEKARVLLAIKKVIPDVVHKAQVEVVRTRRRKK